MIRRSSGGLGRGLPPQTSEGLFDCQQVRLTIDDRGVAERFVILVDCEGNDLVVLAIALLDLERLGTDLLTDATDVGVRVVARVWIGHANPPSLLPPLVGWSCQLACGHGDT